MVNCRIPLLQYNSDIFWVEKGLRYAEFSDKKYVIAVVRDIDGRKQVENVLAAEQKMMAVTLPSIG